MVDKILAGFVVMEIFFVAGGALLLAFAITSKTMVASNPDATTIARNIVLDMCPANAALANAVLIFLTFLLSIPAMTRPCSRAWLKAHGYLVVVNIVFTLVIGLNIWFDTLKTRSTMGRIFARQSDARRSLLQEEFQCCGYTDGTCPTSSTPSPSSPTRACVGPFSAYANGLLDVIFTAAFGIVGFDVLLVLAAAILAKERREQARYRLIDRKNGLMGF